MQTWVREKLDQIDTLFPVDRLSKSKQRWTRLWHGESPVDRYPFVYHPALLGYYEAGQSPKDRMRASLDEFILRGQAHDDFIPAFFPGCHQGTIPGMFGAIERVVDGDYTCDRLIHDVEEISSLADPSIDPGTVASDWLTMERYLLEETEGRIPVHVTDMQGPADVCGQLWGYENFLTAAYTDPEAYHAVMTKVCDAFILLWDRQQEILGDHFIGTHLFGWDWVPPDAGASLSSDSLVMVSPDFYREFYQPHLERIARRFGGLSVHSCGDFSAVVPALCATPGVKAINAGQMSVEELVAAGVDQNTLIIAGASVDNLSNLFSLIEQHSLRVDITISGLWPSNDHGVKPLCEWTAADREGLARREMDVLEAQCKVYPCA